MTNLRLLAVGDISLQTRNNSQPFENVKRVFNSKDILFGNLETVLSTQGEKTKKAVLLYSTPEKARYLKDIDFDVLNIANNHILDLGAEGFINTMEVLNKNGINSIGAYYDKSIHDYLILERNGIKLGFLGYTIGHFKVLKDISINKLKEKKIIADIKSVKDKCDIVIISLHWGTENVHYPSPKQIELAHNLIDNGASVIIGHHPHVIQGIEEYNNGLIAYSLGNFQFNPELSQSRTNSSIILRLNFNENKMFEYSFIPIIINRDFLPCVVKGEEENKISHFISEISQPLKDGAVTNKWWFEQIASTYISQNFRSYTLRIKMYGIKHLLECALWLITPFCIRCYLGIIRVIFKEYYSRV